MIIKTITAKTLTQLRARSKMLCLVTPGRMMPSKGGVASSFSAKQKISIGWQKTKETNYQKFTDITPNMWVSYNSGYSTILWHQKCNSYPVRCNIYQSSPRTQTDSVQLSYWVFGTFCMHLTQWGWNIFNTLIYTCLMPCRWFYSSVHCTCNCISLHCVTTANYEMVQSPDSQQKSREKVMPNNPRADHNFPWNILLNSGIWDLVYPFHSSNMKHTPKFLKSI